MNNNAITGEELERVIQLLAKVPGLGPRSARRAMLHLMKKRDQLLSPLIDAMHKAQQKLCVCEICDNIDTISPCTICCDTRRNPSILIVVEDVADLWALERAHALSGRYHVLGGVLSPLEGVSPEDLSLDKLMKRLDEEPIEEIVLAVNATVEGQTTAHYITEHLSEHSIKITRLAHGVPVGGELDYLDEGTLAAAMRARTPL